MLKGSDRNMDFVALRNFIANVLVDENNECPSRTPIQYLYIVNGANYFLLIRSIQIQWKPEEKKDTNSAEDF